MQNMKMSLAGKIELTGHEGISFVKYRDPGDVWTIGIGMTSTEIPDLANWPADKALTIEQCFEMLDIAIVKYENALNEVLTCPILQTQFDALCSWCYNVGVGWPRKASVIKAINANASNDVLYKDLMLFNKPKSIIGRRTKEALLLTTGKYQNGGMAELLPSGVQINVAEQIQKYSPNIRIQINAPVTSVTQLSFWEQIQAWFK